MDKKQDEIDNISETENKIVPNNDNITSKLVENDISVGKDNAANEMISSESKSDDSKSKLLESKSLQSNTTKVVPILESSTTVKPTVTPAIAESKSGGYAFVGGNIFGVTQDGNGTCVKLIDAEEVNKDTAFTTMMKTTLVMSGGSRSANKKNKTNKKKGGKKHKKSQKHKKAAKKC